MAIGSGTQHIKVYNMNGETLNTIRYHEGFLGQRIGPISTLAFHPYHTMLAAGSTDSLVSIFTQSDFRK